MLGTFFVSNAFFGPPNFFRFYSERVFGAIAFAVAVSVALVAFINIIKSLREDANSLNPMLWMVLEIIAFIIALSGLYILLFVPSCPKAKGDVRCDTIIVHFAESVESKEAIAFVENFGLSIDKEIKTKFLNSSLVEAEIYVDLSPGTTQEKLVAYRDIITRFADNSYVRDCISYENEIKEELEESLRHETRFFEGYMDCTFENGVTLAKAKEVIAQLQIDPNDSDFYQQREALVVQVPPGTAERWAETMRQYKNLVISSRHSTINIQNVEYLYD